ncbi:histidine phosphatase family protein [Lactococcus nasutitermitis]|uniref:Histidine phosphatase family protein n=1 Tax=Lactococcus nasutitermitis TaxID=1652957 RepID=A0ABV9JCB3_9LACT|nr:histidine phosphatase family protein [Lactococcus nasutitermitis]
MVKTLYLMRHGETLFNKLHKIQGWCDSPLTEKGIRQAQIAGNYFVKNQIVIDRAYSSTQERAVDTLELVLKQNDLENLPYKRLKALKEWNFGRFEAESEDLNPKIVPYGDLFVPFDGESQTEVGLRMVEALVQVMQSTDEEKNVLAVSHGGALACFTRASNAENQLPRGLKNCCILKFEYKNNKFTLIESINHDFSELEKR